MSHPFTNGTPDTEALQDEITRLEQQLHAAKLRLQSHNQLPMYTATLTNGQEQDHHLHALLLLSDSALPLGAFAYSSGLESFLAHHPRSRTSPSPSKQLSHFVDLSLSSVTCTTIPYLIAGYRTPEDLLELDNDLDASTPCTVARRASVKQGLALLAVWERSFRAQYKQLEVADEHATAAVEGLTEFSMALKTAAIQPQDEASPLSIFQPNGHLPPLLGALCAALSIPLEQTLYLFLLNHCKTIVSAAIRAGVLGPYQAQSMLAGQDLRERIRNIVEQETCPDGGPLRATANAAVEEVSSATAYAGQTVPVLDLWGGRHEIIYSRIFNS